MFFKSQLENAETPSCDYDFIIPWLLKNIEYLFSILKNKIQAFLRLLTVSTHDKINLRGGIVWNYEFCVIF